MSFSELCFLFGNPILTKDAETRSSFAGGDGGIGKNDGRWVVLDACFD